MREFPFVCTVCDFSAPAAAELAEHLEKTHAPNAAEEFIELVRRGGKASAELEEAVSTLVFLPLDDVTPASALDVRLHRLRIAAAAAIAEQRRPRLRELEAELLALQVGTATERDRLRTVARVALESLEVVRRVLEILPEETS